MDRQTTPRAGGHRAQRVLRWAAGLIAFGLAFVLSGQLFVLARRGVEPVAGLAELLTIDVFVVLSLYGTSLVAGAILQTPVARLRRARVAVGWQAVPALLAYAVPVAVLGSGLSALAPPDGAGVSGRYDPAILDQAFVAAATWGYAVLALTGALFPGRSPAGAQPTGLRARAVHRPLTPTELIGWTTLFSWLIALPMAGLLLLHAAGRTAVGVAVLPPGGRFFSMVGVIGFCGCVVIAAWLAVRARWPRRPSDPLRSRPAWIARRALGIGMMTLAAGLALNQIGRLGPWPVALLLGLAVMVALAVRRRPGPDLSRAPLRDYLGTRVDVVEVLDRIVEQEVSTPHEMSVSTLVECRFADGRVRILDQRDRGSVAGAYPVGARLSVRWDPDRGALVGPPGPAVVPGTADLPPDADQYVVRVRRPDTPASDRDLLVVLGSEYVPIDTTELGVDPEATLRAGLALVRYDSMADRVTEVIPLSPTDGAVSP